MSKIKVIGITGNSGVGKTTVSNFFVEKGIPVIDCDKYSHSVTLPGTDCLNELVEYFSEEILNPDGTLFRKKLGEICFSDPDKKEILNKITHKYILREVDERVKYLQSEKHPLCIVDGATLIESGYVEKCDCVLVVTAPHEARLARILERDGITPDAAIQRMNSQMDQNILIDMADAVIENNGDLLKLYERTEIVYNYLLNRFGDKNMSKNSFKDLEKRLKMNSVSCFEKFDAKTDTENYCNGYIDALNQGKTEREFNEFSITYLESKGFVPFDPKIRYKAGAKVYRNNKNKSLIAAVIGRRCLEDGLLITAAHIDSPRLDLKPNPLYEDKELAFFKTHYYGGIKKYQWVAMPLALHGVIVKKDGETVKVRIGEDRDDPVFCITDLLPHLSHKLQDQRTAKDVISGEELNLLLGSRPYGDDSIKEKVKLNILRLLNEKYGITESDFNSAELEIVPAFDAKYVGFDKSLVGAYGHDDRVCAYTSLTAIAEINKPEYTSLCVLADKEEIGSEGSTGLNSDFLFNFVSLLCKRAGEDSEIVLYNSKCLSADVSAAFDPTFDTVMDPRNCAYLNYGPSIMKYTGSGGKSGTNDAPAEFMAEIREIMDGAGVPWQTGELGKVDEGGGGTVAKYIAAMGVDVVDIGVALLSMHAPYEIASCLDIVASKRAFTAFYNWK